LGKHGSLRVVVRGEGMAFRPEVFLVDGARPPERPSGWGHWVVLADKP
jgi:hypothetical protein